MKNTLSVALALVSAAGATESLADVTVYGRANVSFEAVNEGEASTTELVNNASRLGFTGSETLAENLEAVYRLEYEVYPDDGETFSQRNIYLGVKGNFGQVLAGHFDTPFKTVQNNIDLFNDLRGDIKRVITPNDNRMSNTIEYTTPNNLGGFQAEVALISSEEDGVDDGKSVALSWSNDSLYVGAAMDQDVEALSNEALVGQNAQAMRAVVQYEVGPVQLGGLYEQVDSDLQQSSLSGYVVSALYQWQNDWAFAAQYGASDILYEGGETFSLGATRTLSKNTKVYGFYTAQTADEEDEQGEQVLDNDYVGIGMQLKF